MNFREYIQKLIDNGSAYKCFCTERRLNILRRDAIRHQRIPKYDNKCRSLSNSDIKEKTKAGTPYCIRFKVCCLKFIYLNSSAQSHEKYIIYRGLIAKCIIL